MENEKKSISIELWRFIYCLMIIGLHVTAMLNLKTGTYFQGGSIGVSFFFIVSGYLMTKKAYKNNCKKDDYGRETQKFLFNKIKKLMFYFIIAYVLSFIYYCLIGKIATYQKISSVFELLMLGSSGVKVRVFNYVTWYISVMLICIFIIYPMILKYKDNFIKIIAPFLAIIIGGYISFKFSSIAKGDYIKMLNVGFFQLLIGTSIYPFVEKIKKINFTLFSKILLVIIEFAGFSSILYIVNLENSHVKYDFVMILILTICITIAFSRNSFIKNKKAKSFLSFLGKISLPMYLNQVYIIGFVIMFFQNKNYELNYMIIFAVAVIVDIVVSYFQIKINDKLDLKKFKKFFIKERI